MRGRLQIFGPQVGSAAVQALPALCCWSAWETRPFAHTHMHTVWAALVPAAGRDTDERDTWPAHVPRRFKAQLHAKVLEMEKKDQSPSSPAGQDVQDGPGSTNAKDGTAADGSSAPVAAAQEDAIPFVFVCRDTEQY